MIIIGDVLTVQTYACVLCPVRGDSSAPNSSGPLKRTAANNWAHITCATWIPDLRFGDSSALQPVEGIGALPLAQALMVRYHNNFLSCTNFARFAVYARPVMVTVCSAQHAPLHSMLNVPIERGMSLDSIFSLSNRRNPGATVLLLLGLARILA